jgi:hypothetical protein
MLFDLTAIKNFRYQKVKVIFCTARNRTPVNGPGQMSSDEVASA